MSGHENSDFEAAELFFDGESSDLLAYLREDANRIATFLVVRETGEYETQGLVHAFATREHPSVKAPTLYLKLR